MITRRMEDKLEELKSCFNAKFNEQEESLTKTFNNIIADLKKEIAEEIQHEVSKQCKQLDSENEMLTKHVTELRELNIVNQSRNEELEQYSTRLRLRIDGVPTVKGESSDNVFEFTKSLFKEAKVAVPGNVLDRAHRIGPSYTDRITSKKCKSIIVRYTTFRHRTLFYRARKNLKSAFKVKLDLTKSRFNLLKKVNDHVKEIPDISFCYTDVNCRLRAEFHDAKQEDIFSRFDELRNIVDSETFNCFYNGIKHLQPMFHLCTTLKHWKIVGFPMISGVRKV